MTNWQPISDAQSVTLGTVADLRMRSGRVYRATWRSNGRCIAWWPDDKRRKSFIALYEPVSFRVVAVGITPDSHPEHGRFRRRA